MGNPFTEVGSWPAPPPAGRGALWLGEGLASGILAGWATGSDWVALSAHGELAAHYGRPFIALPGGLMGFDDPGAILAVARQAHEAGAAWLAVPLAGPDESEGLPLALKLAELDPVLVAWGLPALAAPLLRRGWRELGRLGVAYDVPFALTQDCGCGACPTCAGRSRALVAAGVPR
ncbi:MAG: hypothetical protein JWM80_5613 [Cyanobacteria bacterium RYN_339]|nr:hypothetical protein [Cyanobacteria bacterium RYN_339]